MEYGLAKGTLRQNITKLKFEDYAMLLLAMQIGEFFLLGKLEENVSF